MKTEHTQKPNSIHILLAFAATYIIWGSTYLVNKLVIQEIPPFASATLRFSIASVLIFFIAKLLKAPSDLTKEKVTNAGIAGILFLTLGNGGVVWALQYVDTGFAALLISSQPLVLIILMRILQGKKISVRSLAGVVVGILGIFLLTSNISTQATSEYFLGIGIIFLCLLFWGYGSIFVSEKTLPKNPFINSGVQMAIGGALMFPISLALGESWDFLYSTSSQTWLALLYLIIFGSIIAYTAFNYLLKNISPEKVATNTYVNPIVAMILGHLVLHEAITLRSISAGFVLLIGVFIINTRKDR